ncbi:hypothetical protein [Pseudomonas sp. C2B4]|jgi:hypothetical protein|uniref:hypothetical protein n=1 Tax=Pseudomonas sp. C2B4 TaxID=2735270 RepID=UPI0015860DC6|nr:hypothetical protein [Pseudomonas sp. C2B4]NUU34329.1 hypothetical protein [Pseudomonas sp. C2B4]
MNNSPPRRTQGINSVKALHSLLVKIIQHPQQFIAEIELREALKSQGKFAGLRHTFSLDHGELTQTSPMSLNSLKAHADNTIAGGFKALNDLRLKTLEALEFAQKRQERANKRTRSGLSLMVEQLEQELVMQRQTNVILLRAMSEAMTQFKSIRDASDDNLRAKRTQDALSTLRAIVSMNTPPFNLIPVYSDVPLSVEVANLSDFRTR